MKQFGPKAQRLLKCFHLVFAGVWLGAAFGLLLVNLFQVAEDGMELYGINATMKFVDDFAIVPGAVGCFLTGILYSSLTNWGWFKHRWVTIKWTITLYSILSGTFFLGPRLNSLPPLTKAEGLGVLTNSAYVSTKHILYYSGAFQVGILIFAAAISVLKPWKRPSSQ